MNEPIEILKLAVELMRIDHAHWEALKKESPLIRDDRHELPFYVNVIGEQLARIKSHIS